LHPATTSGGRSGARLKWMTVLTELQRGPNRIISLINFFTVDPANQHRLLDLLARATDEFVSRAPGTDRLASPARANPDFRCWAESGHTPPVL
jgi:hypothetical protein